MEQFIELEVKKCGKASHCANDIIILMNLEKEITVKTEDYKTTLSPHDIILLNPGTCFTLKGEEALYVSCTVYMKQFRKMFPGKIYRFLCDSTREINDNYKTLRKYLTDLLMVQYEGKEYQWAEQYKLSCELLIFLVSSFSVMHFTVGNNEKLEEVIAYIRDHFQEELSLKQISNHFHMTAPYFSKYFKKNTGVNYLQYLNKIRLENAVEDLMKSNKNLLYVALDSGFPNAESFHRNFMEVYHQTPQQYRKQYISQQQKQRQEQQDNMGYAVSQLEGVRESETEADTAQIDARDKKGYHPFWCEIINFKDFTLLNNYEVREQFEHLQNELNFHYVRVNLNWEGYEEKGVYSFYQEERAFDFFMGHQLELWFAISVRAVTDTLRLLEYLKRLLSHFVNRYDISRVRNWRFELCYNTIFDEKKLQDYWMLYDKIDAVLKEFQMESELIGAGIELGNWQGMNTFENYRKNSNRNMSVYTMQVDPFTCVETSEGITVNRVTDSSYVKNQIKMLHRNFRDFPGKIYITNWSDSIFQTNILNDSCYRGASIIKNMIDCFGMVDAFAHSVPFDLAYTDKIQDKVLFGGDGLISKEGIKKPSFFAYRFLQNVGRDFIGKTENLIAFGNGNDDYQIVCHNCKALSYRYYMEEEQLKYGNIDTYFVDRDSLTICFRLTNIKNGNYIAKVHSVSQEYGSVQDELRKVAPSGSMVIPDYLHREDVEYFQQTIVPRMRRLELYCVTDGTIELKIKLAANEFVHIEIQYYY